VAILKGDVDRTLDLLAEATRAHPKDLRYWALLADFLLSRGDTQAVEFSVLPAMQRAFPGGNHYLIHAVRGYLLKKKGPSHFKAARLSLVKALSLNAALLDMWKTVLELDAELGNLAVVETDARSLLSIYPDHALANYLLGSVALARGSLAEAEDYLRRSVETAPTAAACNDLAENLRLQHRLDEAEAYARRALSLKPGFPNALDTLANVLLDGGHADASAEYAARAATARPHYPAFQITLLRLALEQGDRDGAKRLARKLADDKVAIPEPLLKKVSEMDPASPPPRQPTRSGGSDRTPVPRPAGAARRRSSQGR
jgi:tetratricopeptide (TPR) repeat protein